MLHLWQKLTYGILYGILCRNNDNNTHMHMQNNTPGLRPPAFKACRDVLAARSPHLWATCHPHGGMSEAWHHHPPHGNVCWEAGPSACPPGMLNCQRHKLSLTQSTTTTLHNDYQLFNLANSQQRLSCHCGSLTVRLRLLPGSLGSPPLLIISPWTSCRLHRNKSSLLRRPTAAQGSLSSLRILHRGQHAIQQRRLCPPWAVAPWSWLLSLLPSPNFGRLPLPPQVTDDEWMNVPRQGHAISATMTDCHIHKMSRMMPSFLAETAI
jgi:hypothetical protein